jgi:hypothetical protein
LAPDVDALVEGCLNVLGVLKMLERAVKPVANPVYLSAGSRVQAEKGGMFFAKVGRDARVQAGRPLIESNRKSL